MKSDQGGRRRATACAVELLAEARDRLIRRLFLGFCYRLYKTSLKIGYYRETGWGLGDHLVMTPYEERVIVEQGLDLQQARTP